MAKALSTRIPDEDLAEHFFAFMNRLMGTLQRTFVEENQTTGITQKDIGDRVGRSPASISRWLSGQQNMTIRTMHDLARGMDCRVDVSLQPLRLIQPANRPPYLDAQAEYGVPQSFTVPEPPMMFEANAAN